jgi:putative tricarboxylic transport membrane protein
VRGADVASALVWLAVGAGVLWSGLTLELGSVSDPGSGFLLFWIGVIMVGLAAAILVSALRRPGEASAPPLFAGLAWGKALVVVATLWAYALALPWLGFLLTTAAALVVLFKAVEPQRWWIAVTGATASALAAYLVFKVWLGAQLPAGVLGVG